MALVKSDSSVKEEEIEQSTETTLSEVSDYFEYQLYASVIRVTYPLLGLFSYLLMQYVQNREFFENMPSNYLDVPKI